MRERLIADATAHFGEHEFHISHEHDFGLAPGPITLEMTFTPGRADREP